MNDDLTIRVCANGFILSFFIDYDDGTRGMYEEVYADEKGVLAAITKWLKPDLTEVKND